LSIPHHTTLGALHGSNTPATAGRVVFELD
jgi:hypothetical protein